MKKLFVLAVLFVSVACLAQSQTINQKSTGLKMSPQFDKTRDFKIPGLEIVDSNESTSISLNGEEIYRQKWNLAYHGSEKVPGRLELIESGDDYFILLGSEMYIGEILYINNGRVVSRFGVCIGNIKKAEIEYIDGKGYLKISFVNNLPNGGDSVPEESILLFFNQGEHPSFF